MGPRVVTQFGNILSSSQLCQNINMRISVAVHVLYGCETRFLSKTGQTYIQGLCRHNVTFGVSTVLGNVKEGNEEGEKIT